MVYLSQKDSYDLFAAFLFMNHENRNYFSGTASIQKDQFEVLVSFDIWLDSPVHVELEYLICLHEAESTEKLIKGMFEVEFRKLMNGFMYHKKTDYVEIQEESIKRSIKLHSVPIQRAV
jgi:hypothetical protein